MPDSSRFFEYLCVMKWIDYRTARVVIERMSDAEFENLAIDYSVVDSDFGLTAVARTEKGICAIVFVGSESEAVEVLRGRFPYADIRVAESCGLAAPGGEIVLHMHGTDFQHEVWRALLAIPYGQVATYGDIALRVGRPSASRAVGSAVGRNPVALLVPCHRVVASGDGLGGYHWGVRIKRMILDYERNPFRTCQVFNGTL